MATSKSGKQSLRPAGLKATSMADLMKSAKPLFVHLKKGENLEGTVTKLTSSEILVDIGAKTEAQVLEKDRNNMRTLLSLLKMGDKVSVSVLNPESDFGNPVVSMRRFLDQRLWDNVEKLSKNKKPQELTVNEETRGGFVVTTADGISGFLPNSHTAGGLNVGQKTNAILLEFDKLQHKIIFSQRKSAGSDEFNKASKTFKIGQKISSTISSIAPFGIFVAVPIGEGNSVEGFVHVSEISWEKSETVPDEYKVGEKVETEVLGFDKKSSRVNLSIKRLKEDPFKEKLKEYTADKKVTGKVLKVMASGISVQLEDNVEGFIKKDKIPVGTTFEEGKEISATVINLDERNHRVMLSPYLTRKTIGYR